jgi:purine-binding chemotaxis protein CheW
MSQGDDIQVVVFRVGGQDFAFNIFHVQRILRYERPAPLPKAPKFLEGVLSVQGAVVPVIDLRKRFELARAEVGEDTRTMILEVEGSPVGAVVDAVQEVLRVSAAQIAPPPPVVRGLAAEYIQGIIAVPGRTVILLQTARLLTSSERIALQALDPEPVHG